MAVKMVKKPVEGSVEVEKNGKPVSQETEKVGMADVSRPTANVGFSAAYTKNLGNYESLKITATLHLPVVIDLTPGADNSEALDDAFLKAQAWVDQKINAVLDELTEET